ncbi:MAG: energy transducer TonB [candidate division NC10 bacterium]|nr:energy transducer TonB [candidate division NC10 bacterium]
MLFLVLVACLVQRPLRAWAAEEMPTFEMEELTVTDTKISKPVLVQEVKPEYPMGARKAGVQGTTLLKIQVLPSGSVGEIQLLQSSGESSLDEAAQKAVKQWKFKPGMSGSKPITVWMTLPVKFELIKEE